MANATTVLGDKQLQKTLKRMRETSARRVATAGSAEAAKVLTKAVKSKVPSRYKSIRKAIAWRRLKKREAVDGGAKIGAAVARGSKAYARGKSSSQKGIGIGANNIQWWFLGSHKTPNRHTGKSGGAVIFTGKMPAQMAPVQSIANSKRGQMGQAFVRGATKRLEKEIQKGKAF